VAGDGEEVVSGRLRRYYRLTEDGAEAVRVEADRMRRAAALVALKPAAT
jgi:PadR family transcriptional regulator, regulatory protein PadR